METITLTKPEIEVLSAAVALYIDAIRNRELTQDDRHTTNQRIAENLLEKLNY